MTQFLQIAVLAIIQGLAELLPVSSTAHVIVAARLMGIRDTSTPQFALLLVMLHTGTMFAVILYFWKEWKKAFFSSQKALNRFVTMLVIATAATGIVGLILKLGIEAVIRHRHPGIAKAEVEELWKHLDLLAASLAAVGVLILIAGFRRKRGPGYDQLTPADSMVIGLVQGLCLPFRGFSRSGATISVGLLRGLNRRLTEEFSFALAVVLTPVLIVYEGRRLLQHQAATPGAPGAPGAPVDTHAIMLALIGMVLSFAAGLVALRLLSRVLEGGRWWTFGVYCLAASCVVFALYLANF